MRVAFEPDRGFDTAHCAVVIDVRSPSLRLQANHSSKTRLIAVHLSSTLSDVHSVIGFAKNSIASSNSSTMPHAGLVLFANLSAPFSFPLQDALSGAIKLI